MATEAPGSAPSPVQVALDAAIARFSARNPRSAELYAQAATSMPGGNTRSLLYTSPFPVILKRGKDYLVISEDGHTYTDMVSEMTAGLFGHSNLPILAALSIVMTTTGLNLGGNTALEHAHAAAMCARFGLDRVRFANSGTEANLHALAAARAFTGRRKVVVFAGGYHGSVLAFKEGGPHENTVDPGEWVIARYNDLDSARVAIKSEGVAAVLIEGMQGSAGAMPGGKEFLVGVQEAAKEAGVLFILDEVMTSRLATGGLASIHGLTPDLKTFGKWLGGGLAFGAFGGREDIMAVFDPRAPGHLMHNGTFNNNTLVMRAGHVGLTEVFTPDVCVAFNAMGTALLERLAEVTKGTKMCFTGMGTIFASHFTEAGLQPAEFLRQVAEIGSLKELFWYEMLEEGFWLTKRGSHALVLGTPQAELDRFVECVGKFLQKHAELVKV